VLLLVDAVVAGVKLMDAVVLNERRGEWSVVCTLTGGGEGDKRKKGLDHSPSPCLFSSPP